MAFNPIGTVSSLTGEASALDDKGIRRPLKPGDPVFPNEIIRTAEQSLIEIRFIDGSLKNLGSQSELTLDNEVLNSASTTLSNQSDIEALQAAIEAGKDPTEVTQAPAAGQVEDDGSDIVQVEYNDPRATPESGFDTRGIAVQFTEPVEELLLDPEEAASLASQGSIPTLLDPQDTVGDQPNPVPDSGTVDEASLNSPMNQPEQTEGQLTLNTGNDPLASLTVNGQLVAENGNTLIPGQFGTLEIDQSGEWTYTLNGNTLTHGIPNATGANDQVADVFNFTVTDVDGDTASSTLTININDDGPTAVDDSITLNEGATVTGNLVDNDTQGADGASISAINGNPVAAQGNTVINTQNGTLTVAADGAYTFVANANTSGTQTLQYTLIDGDGDSNQADFAITVTQPTVFDLTGTVVQTEGTLAEETDYNFSVSRSGDVSQAGSVDYSITSGVLGAVDSLDFVNPDLLNDVFTLNFEAGETEKQIAIAVRGDISPEEIESFTVNLSNPTGTNTDNVLVNNDSATGVILEDDIEGDLQFLTIRPDDVLSNPNVILGIDNASEITDPRVQLIDIPVDNINWENEPAGENPTDFTYGPITVEIGPAIIVDIV